MFSLSDYDYQLPEHLIAQEPTAERDHARLLHLNRVGGDTSHHRFYDIVRHLNPGDVLVLNNTRVIPARFSGRKATGGKVEVLLVDYAGGRTSGDRFTADCLVKASKAPRTGTVLHFPMGVTAEVLQAGNDTFTLAFKSGEPFEDILERIGRVPLPPYIRRLEKDDQTADRIGYQTVYAARKGAVAAPTAGLHFTTGLLEQLTAKGVRLATITLHIGYGTFKPVRVDDIRRHRMHFERYSLSAESAEMINRAKADRRRVVAVGTTCVRTLEFTADPTGRVHAGSGQCDLFIYPGYGFKVVDAMITNFHLPRSTLLMLVSAFAGRQNILNAYREAIEQGYRFYSYGDAMLIA